ncbi:MAG: penicillin-binding protein 2 [Armatimonadota bacterium]
MAAKYLKFFKKRTAWLLVIFGVLYLMIAGRLFFIQVLNNEHYRKFAEDVRLRQPKTPAIRGDICDRNGSQLATSVPACAVYINPKQIKDRQKVVAQLSQLIGMDQADVDAIIGKAILKRRTFVYIKRQLPPEIGDKVRKANIPAVGILSESKRVYPCGSLAAHILGFACIDGIGREGIERAEDHYLKGRDGYTEAEVDSKGRIIPETERRTEPPVNGCKINLTIDAYLQHVTEEALAASFKKYHAVGATAIVLDPRTGEILALANCPAYDPNNRKGVKADVWRNRAITDLYEPGSTLKMVTVSAGVEEGLSPTEVMATCTRQGMQIGKNKVRCSLHAPYGSGHGAVNMFAIIRHSCNIGAAAVALRIGPDKFYSYLKGFGLQSRPGSEMSGETYFPLGSPDGWSAIKLANIGFGQGIAVSPLQMACAYGAIANGGKLMQPRVIREIRDQDGKLVRAFDPKVVRQVVSEATARKVTEMLMDCVDDGTGKTSKIEGYSVAGKTGSAQKARVDGRGYAPGKFIASFMGFVPARNPRLVICVAVDEPKGTHWGATVAGPVFKEIAQRAMLHLGVQPDEPLSPEIKVKGNSGA